jgi:UDP-N-acetyl-D-glucosamine/UDP-N-acetyl-D-galactosamine dehydrogenase
LIRDPAIHKNGLKLSDPAVSVAYGQNGRVIGFDINQNRLQELKNGKDTTGEVPPEVLATADILLTDRIENLQQADFHIVAVPIRVNEAKQLDRSLLIKA